MPVHLTPTELADELQMKRREVLSKCIEMNVPVLKGRIDRTLFESSLRAMPGPGQAGDGLEPNFSGRRAAGKAPAAQPVAQ